MLVRALTGMEPDRWETEQRRGMTIDLGFAWMTLPSGQEIAFVDVPGHERFITNMLAGAGPAPGVLFVVAADEGWMPQSAEHLAAIDALGVRNGLLVVTRADLADPAPVLEQATLKIADSSLGEVEAIPVSALTGQGLPELAAALGRAHGAAPRARPGRQRAALAGPGVRHQGQRDGGHRDLAGGDRAHGGRADGDPRHAHAAGQERAVTRRTGRPGQWRRPGGAEPARGQYPGAGPRHGPHPRWPLDGDQRG